MSEWKTPKELLGNSKRTFEVLGGRTMAENFAFWDAKWAKGEGHVDPTDSLPIPYGPHWAGHWPPGWKPGDAIRPKAEPPDLAGTLAKHLERIAVPPRLAAVIQAGPKESPCLLAMRGWLASGKSFLLLHGEADSGKSCAAAAAFLERKRPRWLDGQLEWDSHGCFVDAAEIAQHLFTEAGKDLLQFLAESPFVVIDELGVETASGPWHSAFDTLINKRFGNPALRTILATNVSAARTSVDKPSDFEARYGARVARRIRESGVVFAADRKWRAAA